MGEPSENTLQMEEDLYAKSPSDLEQEAYDGEPEDEEEDELDVDLNPYIDSTVRSVGAVLSPCAQPFTVRNGGRGPR